MNPNVFRQAAEDFFTLTKTKPGLAVTEVITPDLEYNFWFENSSDEDNYSNPYFCENAREVITLFLLFCAEFAESETTGE